MIVFQKVTKLTWGGRSSSADIVSHHLCYHQGSLKPKLHSWFLLVPPSFVLLLWFLCFSCVLVFISPSYLTFSKLCFLWFSYWQWQQNDSTVSLISIESQCSQLEEVLSTTIYMKWVCRDRCGLLQTLHFFSSALLSQMLQVSLKVCITARIR